MARPKKQKIKAWRNKKYNNFDAQRDDMQEEYYELFARELKKWN